MTNEDTMVVGYESITSCDIQGKNFKSCTNYESMENERNQSKTKTRYKEKETICDISNKAVKNELVNFMSEILCEICDSIENSASEYAVMRNSQFGSENQMDEKYKKQVHRKTYILEDSVQTDCFGSDNNNNRDSLYSVDEFDEILDENDNTKCVNAVNSATINDYAVSKITKSVKHPTETKPLKKFTLGSFFRKKSKHKKYKSESEHEEYDRFDSYENLTQFPKSTLAKSKKYSSAADITEKSLTLSRTPSFIKKKLSDFHSDSKSFLKRSFSLRDLSKKKDKSRDKLIESKNSEWMKSLQSLVENDVSVSYNDLSFVNYDALNTISYDNNCDEKKTGNVKRTQSLNVKRTPNSHKVLLSRGTSITDDNNYQHNANLIEQSGALSLPSLYYLNQENVDSSASDTSPTHRYRRRPQSINSDDGRSRPSANGSFRSAGSGCAKLKRHNACRQKNRDTSSLHLDNRQQDDQTVRSRSLNHLDTLEMRQGVVASSDAALKDARSEPDCTRPLLAPPSVIPDPPSPTNEAPTRRHMLSRSQKSSSECFSVTFEVGEESTYETELFFPATRGVTLHDSLFKLCELRSIDLSSCDVWLSDKDSNTNTWLALSQDTASLVGRHIRITAKETSNKKLSGSVYGNHARKPSGSFRPRTNSFFSSSTEDAPPAASSTLSLHEFDPSKKQGKQPRWSGFFSNNKDTRMDSLIEQLNNYSKYGVPSCQIYPQGQCESIDALYKLEHDWRDIVDSAGMSEKQHQQQTALWELIKTEVAYIKTLKVVTDLFLACLRNLQSVNLLKEIDTEKLFSNITEILDANVLFWRNNLFPLVRDMRKDKQPPCIENMCEGFSKMKETFQAYFRYCAEQSRCQHYCRENHAQNEVFAAYLAWCETQKDCNRLRLMDILVQPMQRLTKYGLLLKAILKNTDDEIEKESLCSMIKMVDDFVNSVNYSLQQKQDNERLKGIIARIESYDIVDSKDDDIEKLIKSYSHLDLNRPMLNCPPERKRHLLLEGDLKLKDSNTSKMEVHCFLLTDMLLICKPSTKKGCATMRVIRQPYLVDRLVMNDLSRETPSIAVIYKNEFDMATAAFILQNNDAKKLKSWKDGIKKAQALYTQAKQTSYMTEESLDTDYSLDYNLESDYHSLQLAPKSPLASSSRASRVSSLAHSHSGSVEMNDQSSVGSIKDQSRGVSMENENRTASISSDEGVQPLPPDKSPVSQKNSFKHRLFNKTPNTLSVQPYTSLGQSLPNLTLGSPNLGTLNLSLNQNTLSVPNSKNAAHLLSPTHRGISYPPPSPTRGNLRRGLAITQNKNPPLIKTRHVNSTTACTSGQMPASFDFDVPVIAGISPPGDQCDSFSRGHHRQAMMKRFYRNDNKRYHTAGVVDDIKRSDNKDSSIHKRLSWNCSSQEQRVPNEDQT